MNTPLLFGNLRPVDKMVSAFRNREADTILRGEPVVFAMDGTNDGVDATHSSTAGANKCKAAFLGVALRNTPSGEYGVAQTWGLCQFVRCSASLAANRNLTVNSGSNNFGDGNTTATYDAVTTIGPATLPFASSFAATGTVDGVANVASRVMLRAM